MCDIYVEYSTTSGKRRNILWYNSKNLLLMLTHEEKNKTI